MTSPLHSRPSRIRVAALICAVTVTTLLAACSSPAPGASGAGSSVPAHPSSAPSKPAPVAAINVCGLVPIDTVARASGLDLSSSTPDPSSTAAGIFGCSYDSGDGSSNADLESQLDVSVYVSGAFTIKILKDALDASASADAPTVPVSGIGDEAYASAGGFVAKFGSHLIKVSGLSSDLNADHSESQAVAAAFITAIGS